MQVSGRFFHPRPSCRRFPCVPVACGWVCVCARVNSVAHVAKLTSFLSVLQQLGCWVKSGKCRPVLPRIPSHLCAVYREHPRVYVPFPPPPPLRRATRPLVEYFPTRFVWFRLSFSPVFPGFFGVSCVCVVFCFPVLLYWKCFRLCKLLVLLCDLFAEVKYVFFLVLRVGEWG